MKKIKKSFISILKKAKSSKNSQLMITWLMVSKISAIKRRMEILITTRHSIQLTARISSSWILEQLRTIRQLVQQLNRKYTLQIITSHVSPALKMESSLLDLLMAQLDSTIKSQRTLRTPSTLVMEIQSAVWTSARMVNGFSLLARLISFYSQLTIRQILLNLVSRSL